MKTIFTITLTLCFMISFSQQRESEDERLLTAGFQLRPVVASRFLGAGEETKTDRIFTSTIKPALGYTFGMVIRRGITKKISIETGINYIRRNYTMTNVDDSVNYTDVANFGMVSYEIPVQGLIYVRLGKRFYMNTSLGVSINWFASDVATLGQDNNISQYTLINRVIFNPSMLANLGFEYRTEKAGFFYLGASLHRPFIPIANTRVKFDNDSKTYYNIIPLSGAFVTLDARYFFHEQPVKRKVNKEKKKR